MRSLLPLAAAVLLSTFAGTIGAHAAAWCAWYDPYTYNCGFYTFEQCQYTVIGSGGWCARNVYESTPQPPPAAVPQRHRKHRRSD